MACKIQHHITEPNKYIFHLKSCCSTVGIDVAEHLHRLHLLKFESYLNGFTIRPTLFLHLGTVGIEKMCRNDGAFVAFLFGPIADKFECLRATVDPCSSVLIALWESKSNNCLQFCFANTESGWLLFTLLNKESFKQFARIGCYWTINIPTQQII